MALRAQKLETGMAHLMSVIDYSEHQRILRKVEEKYGKRFADDLRAMFFKGKQ
jgi:hypothetical protein